MPKKPDFEAFAKAVMKSWPIGDLDGFELQSLAETHGLIAPVPGGFDPEKHEDLHGCGVEPGEPWFETTYAPKVQSN